MISGEVLGNVPVMLKLANTALSNLEASTSLANNPMTLVQIALAVKSVPFEDIVFVQYPTGADYADPNKVVPNEEAAAALWDAIEANAQLQITHQNNSNDGVVVQEPTAPVEEATPDPSATPDNVVGAAGLDQGQFCGSGDLLQRQRPLSRDCISATRLRVLARTCVH